MGAGHLTFLALRHWTMITISLLNPSVQQQKSSHTFPNDCPAGGILGSSKFTFLALKQLTLFKIWSKKLGQKELLLSQVAELWIWKMKNTNRLSRMPKSDHIQKVTGRERFLNFRYFIQAFINIFLLIQQVLWGPSVSQEVFVMSPWEDS